MRRFCWVSPRVQTPHARTHRAEVKPTRRVPQPDLSDLGSAGGESEVWLDTVKRVVEGTFEILQHHTVNRLCSRWDEELVWRLSRGIGSVSSCPQNDVMMAMVHLQQCI